MTIFIGQNDTEPAVQDTLKRGGSAVDLSSASAVNFHMANASSGSVKVSTTASIVTAASGDVKYVWSASDTDTAGTFEAEWEVDWGGSSIETFPNTDSKIGVKVASEIA